MTEITDIQAQQFETSGWIVFPSFLTKEIAASIRHEVCHKSESGDLKKAGIGREHSFQLDGQRRGDFIQWIDPSRSDPATALFLQKIHELITLLNRTFYIGIRSFECHYALYPPGTHYERHIDRHKDGSSRLVSFVLYLNENWIPDHGGQLVIYPENEQPVSVSPQQGTLAVFLSELEHEVLHTSHERISITGWMHNRESGIG